jgi:hypothetical protein
MSDGKKSKDVAPKKPVPETKAVAAKGVEAKPVEAKAVEGKPVETKAVEGKTVEGKAETSPTSESKPDAAPKKQGMGEGQKAVTQAYKDNWNDIFGKKKKR